jgi:hypothetical protein
MLFVKPEWQGFGVGHELLQWGLTQADLRRLPAYLESSAAVRCFPFLLPLFPALTPRSLRLTLILTGKARVRESRLRGHQRNRLGRCRRQQDDDARYGTTTPTSSRRRPETNAPHQEAFRRDLGGNARRLGRHG